MKYAVIQNGFVSSVIDGPAGFAIAGQVLVACNDVVARGDTYDGSSFSRPTSAPAQQTMFAPYDFLALFTQAELLAVLTSTDPTLVIARTRVQTIITFVDLTNPDTVSLIEYLVLVGILTSDRATAVLAGQLPS